MKPSLETQILELEYKLKEIEAMGYTATMLYWHYRRRYAWLLLKQAFIAAFSGLPKL